MELGYLVFRPDSLTFTVCNALGTCGHGVSILVADDGFESRAASSIQKRVSAIGGVRSVGCDMPQRPATFERLIVQATPRQVDVLRDLPRLAARASAITLISAGDRSRSWIDAFGAQWFELTRLGTARRRVDRVLFKDGFYRVDLFGVFRHREVVGFDVHSQFLSNAQERDAMHATDWSLEDVRPYLVNFLGSRDPQPRLAILDTMRHLFVSQSGQAKGAPGGKQMYWCEYSDATPGGLPPLQFVDTLTKSDFTLCPRGYSLVTHRPIEALLRGSIPVLRADELDLYGVALVDGKTCIAVDDDGWARAVERILAMPEAQIRAMRQNVQGIRPALDYATVAAGICRRLGV